MFAEASRNLEKITAGVRLEIDSEVIKEALSIKSPEESRYVNRREQLANSVHKDPRAAPNAIGERKDAAVSRTA
jgi:hypothetical protein